MILLLAAGCCGLWLFVAASHLGTCISFLVLSAQACGLFAVSTVGVATEHVGVAGDILLSEVEEDGGVECNATQTGLEVEMRTRAAACASSQTYHLASLYRLVLGHELL